MRFLGIIAWAKNSSVRAKKGTITADTITANKIIARKFLQLEIRGKEKAALTLQSTEAKGTVRADVIKAFALYANEVDFKKVTQEKTSKEK